MTQRKNISKRIRFEVFKRDGFRCQYCGAVPPSVTLEIDHIIPVSKRGTNNIENLVTSCWACNSGKSDKDLTSIPKSINFDVESIKERHQQYKEYQKYISSMDDLFDKDIQIIGDVYSKCFPNYCLSEHFKNSSVKNFVSALGFKNTYDAMVRACATVSYSEGATKYFCGICWNMIKNNRRSIDEKPKE